MRPSYFHLFACAATLVALISYSHAAPTKNPAPDASTRAAAKTGNEIDKSLGPKEPISSEEMAHAISLSGVKNPAQALATAEIKNREGEAVGSVSSVDVAPDG